MAAAGAGLEAAAIAEEEERDNYKVAAKVDLKTLVEKDSEDESLKRYKASLLGAAAADPSAAASDKETRQVVVHEMRIKVEGRPDIVVPLGTPEDVAAFEKSPLSVKEGVSYTTVIAFSVHKDVVLGLKFSNVVTNSLGIPLDKTNQMIGSYPPDGKRVEFTFPVAEWPSGMFARGTYKAKTAFKDDDGNTHLAFNWAFEIKKQWPDEK